MHTLTKSMVSPATCWKKLFHVTAPIAYGEWPSSNENTVYFFAIAIYFLPSTSFSKIFIFKIIFHPVLPIIKLDFCSTRQCYYSADFTTRKPVSPPTNSGGFKFPWKWQRLQGADCVSTIDSALHIGKTARCWPCLFVLPRMMHDKWTNKCHCKSCILLG